MKKVALLSLFVGSVAAATIGCSPVLTCLDEADCSGVNTSSGEGSQSGSTGGSGGSGQGSGSGGTGGAGGSLIEPATHALLFGADRVTLRLATFPLSCSDPGSSNPYGTCSWAELEVTFPLEMMNGGMVDGSHPSVEMHASETGNPNSPNPEDCPGTGSAAGGAASKGRIEFGEFDGSAVPITVSGFDWMFLDAKLDGSYTASRCF